MQRPDGVPAQYIALHKPYMTLCILDADEKKGRATLASLRLPAGLVNVGRLDRDSEGLLLLTNDGAFCHRVLQGDHVTKRYYALVAGVVSDEAVAAMAAGGHKIRGRSTRACGVRRLDWHRTEATLAASRVPPQPHTGTRTAANSTWLEVLLAEGMNRQVRRMTEHARHRTLRLMRMGVGALRAEDLALAPGEWAAIQPSDVLGDGAGGEAGAGERGGAGGAGGTPLDIETASDEDEL